MKSMSDFGQVRPTDLHPALNFSFVSHTTGVIPVLVREERCRLEEKHRMGLWVGWSLRPRRLHSTAGVTALPTL